MIFWGTRIAHLSRQHRILPRPQAFAPQALVSFSSRTASKSLVPSFVQQKGGYLLNWQALRSIGLCAGYNGRLHRYDAPWPILVLFYGDRVLGFKLLDEFQQNSVVYRVRRISM